MCLTRILILLISNTVFAASYFDTSPLAHKREVHVVTDLHAWVYRHSLGNLSSYEMAALVKGLSKELKRKSPRWIQWHPVLQYLMVDNRPDQITEEDGRNIVRIRPMVLAHNFSPNVHLQIDHMMEKLKGATMIKIIRAFDMVPSP